MKKLNYVQNRLAQAFRKNIFAGLCNRGIFCAPTGTGKTGTARAMINLYADKFFNTGEGSGYSFFLTPRIALTDQQSTALVNFRILDDEFPDTEIIEHVVHSKSSDQYLTRSAINDAINSAKEQGKYLVFFSTYKSAKYLSSLTPDLIICDEAHHVVSNQTYDTVMFNLNEDSPRVFLTATPKEVEGENTQGFNNTSKFGQYLAEIAPRRAIDERLIVPPRLHVFYANSSKSQFETVVSQIIHSFKTHKNFNPLIPAKVLYVMAGANPVDIARENWSKIHKRTGAKVFTIITSGENPGEFIDGVLQSGQNKREDFFDAFEKHDGPAIMCHYATVGEGIDLPSLTGVVIMRNTELGTTVQSVGRAIRIHNLDRDEFGIGVELNERIKKYALVTVVVFNENTDIETNVGAVVKNLRKAGFDSFKEKIIVSREKNNGDDDDSVGRMDNGEDDDELADFHMQYELTEVMSKIELDIELEMELKDLRSRKAEFKDCPSILDSGDLFEFDA